jgi:large subunit ribosomal protein L21
MFAVVKTGGKQYKVASGEVLKIEKIAGNAGEKVQFNEVLMLGGDKTTVGTPTVAGAGVQAEILEQAKGPKVINYVKRRRKHSSQRKKGHRQQLTVVRITDILATGADKSGVTAALNGAGFVVAAGAAGVAAAAPKKAKAEKKAAPAKAAAPKKAQAEKAAPAATAGADDLKELSGVGPALEKKLHAAGVTSFAQVAAWTDADVEDFGEKLSFKGRIEREGWIDQAKKLAKG